MTGSIGYALACGDCGGPLEACDDSREFPGPSLRCEWCGALAVTVDGVVTVEMVEGTKLRDPHDDHLDNPF